MLIRLFAPPTKIAHKKQIQPTLKTLTIAVRWPCSLVIGIADKSGRFVRGACHDHIGRRRRLGIPDGILLSMLHDNLINAREC
ncbi:hypothetical protein JOC55_004080 [Paenibacillus sacheonensis]|nr:hypothetical protein [Paenibacillus sacheonensis]